MTHRSSPVTADAILADIVEHWENLKRDEGAFPPGDRRAAMSEHRLWHSIQSAKAWLRAPAQCAPGLDGVSMAIEACARAVDEIPSSASLYESARIAEAVTNFKKHAVEIIKALSVTSTEAPAPVNETSRDWDVCRAVDLYREPRNEGDGRTLSDFLADRGIALSVTPENGKTP